MQVSEEYPKVSKISDSCAFIYMLFFYLGIIPCSSFCIPHSSFLPQNQDAEDLELN